MKAKIRNALVTWNNPPTKDWDDLVAMLKPAYMVGQLERGESGTLHWQFAVQWQNPRSFAAIKKDMPLAHFEEVRSWAAAVQYCQKEDSRQEGPWEYGTRPTGGSGKAQEEDWEVWYQLAAEGKFKEIPAKIQIKHLGNLERIHRQNLKFIDQTDVRGVWIWGAPGVGKSHFARQVLGQQGYYPKLNNKWWDGYQGQQICVMEDVDKETIKFLHHHLKIWADRWGFIGETKGGAVAPNHRWLVVTSNYSIMEILQDLEDRALATAIMRRFKRYQMLERNEIKDWDTYETLTPEQVAEKFK